jgi:hypothetical protein
MAGGGSVGSRAFEGHALTSGVGVAGLSSGRDLAPQTRPRAGKRNRHDGRALAEQRRLRAAKSIASKWRAHVICDRLLVAIAAGIQRRG